MLGTANFDDSGHVFADLYCISVYAVFSFSLDEWSRVIASDVTRVILDREDKGLVIFDWDDALHS